MRGEDRLEGARLAPGGIEDAGGDGLDARGARGLDQRADSGNGQAGRRDPERGKPRARLSERQRLDRVIRLPGARELRIRELEPLAGQNQGLAGRAADRDGRGPARVRCEREDAGSARALQATSALRGRLMSSRTASLAGIRS